MHSENKTYREMLMTDLPGCFRQNSSAATGWKYYEIDRNL